MTTTNILGALGAGSGIDVKNLAQSLVDTERLPRKERIDQQIAKTEARISGYGAIKFALSALKSAFEKLNDSSDFSNIQTANTQPAALSVQASTAANAGSSNVQISQIAKPQRTASTGFNESNISLNFGATMQLSLDVAGQDSHTLEITQPTPNKIVSAINNAKKGVTAQLINTGNGHQILLTGQNGATNTFQLSTTGTNQTPAAKVETDDGSLLVSAETTATQVRVSYTNSESPPETTYVALEPKGDGLWGLPDGAAPLPNDVALSIEAHSPIRFDQSIQNPQDALLNINGLDIRSASNTITNVIEGVTLELFTPTNGEARLDLNRDTSGIKDNIRALVAAYKDFEETVKVLADRESTVEQFGGALAGDNLLQSIRNQMRAMLGESSTPGQTIKAARNVGLGFDRNGNLSLDEQKLDTALQDNFEEVLFMFSAGTNNQSVYSTTNAGLAGDAVRRIDIMLRSTGMIEKQTRSANTQIGKFQDDLLKLDERMEKLMSRYIQQFSVMESIVGNSNSIRDGLKSRFEGMMAAYK